MVRRMMANTAERAAADGTAQAPSRRRSRSALWITLLPWLLGACTLDTTPQPLADGLARRNVVATQPPGDRPAPAEAPPPSPAIDAAGEGGDQDPPMSPRQAPTDPVAPPGDGPAMDVPELTDDLLPDEDIERLEGVSCQAEGVWAIRATVDAAWGGRTGGLAALTDDGRGDIVVHMMGSIERIDGQGNFIGNVRICGTTLPPFYSTTLCESYQPTFPVEVWESSQMPVLPLTGHVECNHPGCAIRFNPSTGLLGVQLKQPLSPWPLASDTTSIVCPAGEGEDCFPDHDDNDYPGITVKLLTDGIAPKEPGGLCFNGYAYRPPPLREDIAVITGGVRRADRLHLGTRTTLGGIGLLTDCEHGHGGGIAEGFASRAIGCLAAPGSYDAGSGKGPAGKNDDCDEEQRQFVDENLPEYHLLSAGERPAASLDLKNDAPSPGPQFAVVRMGGLDEEFTCAEVRSARFE